MNRNLFLSIQWVCLNLGGRLGFGAGWTKTRPEKRSVGGYVSIFWAGFRSTCAKYNRTYSQRVRLLLLLSLALHSLWAAPHFHAASPQFKGVFHLNGPALCTTARETLAYLNKGSSYDPLVIHPGKAAPIPLQRIKATLVFICKHQAELNQPEFLNKYFDFIRWEPDLEQVRQNAAHKPLLAHLPPQKILMTKYYVHLAKASLKPTASKPYALYALPLDESNLSVEEANQQAKLLRFRYGKQAILKGALKPFAVPSLAYLSREDLEAALLQGTLIADFGTGKRKKILNVHRNNNLAYDKSKPPYEQERYWYFKQVSGIKGYGKDAEYKITIDPQVSFAADLSLFGLGKMLLIQYPDQSGTLVSRAGLFADTGGAFEHNSYQIDYLAGSYPGKKAFIEATQKLPDYVDAYFMVLKPEYYAMHDFPLSHTCPRP